MGKVWPTLLPNDVGGAQPIDELRVLVFAPRGRDAALTVAALAKEGVAATACPSVATLCEEMLAGAGTALLSEEALEPGAIAMLGATLAQQPAWSDFPLVLFGDSTPEVVVALDAAVNALGNVTILERPVRLRTMIGTVRTALRTRGRQYGGRAAIHSRDQFLAMLGHELRNPLAAVRMAIELLERYPGDHATQARHRGVIERQSRHLARLVDDLLDVARVTYGKVALQKAQVDVSEVLHGVVLAYDHVAKASNLKIATHIATDLVVKGDRVRLDQVFGNLLANALKYTPRGGSVDVEAHADEGDIVVTLTDSGIGIDAATLPRVFELFAQADRSLDRAQGGMGLGLTLVQSLVQLHDGKVSARSGGTGKGSAFTVRLPLLLESDRDEAGADSCPRTPRFVPRRVVVVDDSEDVRCTVTELLEAAGFDVTTAVSGPTGFARIVESRPDVAFVDIG